MQAMTDASEIHASRNALSQPDSTAEPDTMMRTEQRTPLHSGLSALILAATSHLTDVAEDVESEPWREDQRPSSGATSDDNGSVDEHERRDPQSRTPVIIPEPDPMKQSFPELLMTLGLDPNLIDVIAFLPDGKYFAIRSKEFSERLMHQYFAVKNFDDFLDLAHDWGFTRLVKEPSCAGIEVFRHPQFQKSNWEKLSLIKFGESPRDVRVSALPERSRIECTVSDDSSNPGQPWKRRLSPTAYARRESESSVSSQKQKVFGSEDATPQKVSPSRKNSYADSDTAESAPATSIVNTSRGDDLRSVALSITTEKLNLKYDDKDCESDSGERPLVERGVRAATSTIVCEAIETLLWDKNHTVATYMKHEKSLSTSTLPGVVPISKQLFSPASSGEAKEAPPEEVELPQPIESEQPDVHDPPEPAAGNDQDEDSSQIKNPSSVENEPQQNGGRSETIDAPQSAASVPTL